MEDLVNLVVVEGDLLQSGIRLCILILVLDLIIAVCSVIGESNK